MRGQLTAAQLNERKNTVILSQFGKLIQIDAIKIEQCPFFKQIKTSPFLIVTAFKNGFDLEENRFSNEVLNEDFRSKGLGGLKLRGHFIQDEGLPIEHTEPLEGYILSLDKNRAKIDLEGFEAFGRMICEYYEQDFVFFSDGEAIFPLNRNGRMDAIGKQLDFHPDLFEKYYSEQKGRRFVIEGYASPSSYIDAMHKAQQGIYYWYSFDPPPVVPTENP